jgi:hypothetical protein
MPHPVRAVRASDDELAQRRAASHHQAVTTGEPARRTDDTLHVRGVAQP